jgi:hypothetical protein
MNLVRPTRIQRGPRHRIPTAPFHPYLHLLWKPDHQKGGLFSAALAIGSRLPGVTWHLTLWSPDFPLSVSRQRLPS